MNLPDLVNGSFELLAGVVSLANCRTLHHDKKVQGVNPYVTVFFTGWGFWNLYYYPSLNQWLSFYGGLSIVGVNMLWLGMLLYYKRKRK
jgi:hypothetical protein